MGFGVLSPFSFVFVFFCVRISVFVYNLGDRMISAVNAVRDHDIAHTRELQNAPNQNRSRYFCVREKRTL